MRDGGTETRRCRRCSFRAYRFKDQALSPEKAEKIAQEATQAAERATVDQPQSSRCPGATKLNAEAIRDLCDRASRNLTNVVIELMAAVERAENDYPNNGDRLRDALGALRLVSAVVATEHHTWADYARNRTEETQS